MAIFGNVLRPEDQQVPQMFGSDILQTPEAQAALLAFGLNVMNPTYGSVTGPITQGIGAAGEAAQKVTKNRQEAEEIEFEREDKRLKREFDERREVRDERRLDDTERRTRAYEKGIGLRGGQSLSSLMTNQRANQSAFRQFINEKRKTFLTQKELENFDNMLLNDKAFQDKLSREFQNIQRMGAQGTVGTPALGGEGAPAAPSSGSLPVPPEWLASGLTAEDWALQTLEDQQEFYRDNTSGNN